MLDLKNMWKTTTEKVSWTARRAALMTKLQATKAVWMAPTPQAATAASKKTSRGAKKAARKTPRTSKKTAAGAKR
jgi:hypothetical protein